MPKKSFEFTEETQVILCNLQTVRQIQRVCANGGALQRDVKQLLKHLEAVLPQRIDVLNLWESEIASFGLYFSPSRQWKVVKGDGIALCISFEQLVEPAFYSDEDDPWTGLYVPAQWKYATPFIEALKTILPTGFRHFDGSDEYDATYPIWSQVRIRPLPNTRALRLDAFEKEVVDRMAKLVAIRPKIERLIERVRNK